MDETNETQAGTSPEQNADAGAGSGVVTQDAIVAAIKTCYDPEIPVDIYELGLIYEIDIQADASVKVKMTLTSPMCPVAEILPGQVQTTVARVDGVTSAEIDLVWEPPWDPSMMSEAAKLELGF